MLLIGGPTLESVIARCEPLRDRLRKVTVSIVLFEASSGVPQDKAFVAGISAQQKAIALRRVGTKADLVIIGHPWREHIRAHSALNCSDFVVLQRPFPDGFDAKVPTAENLLPAAIDLNFGPRLGRPLPAVADACIRLVLATMTGTNTSVAVVGGEGYVGRHVTTELERLGIRVLIFEKCDRLDALSSASTVISATGQPDLIQPDLVRDGAVVIDAGFHSTVEQPWISRGDVARAAYARARVVTPVPGGVGVFQVATVVENLAARFGLERRWMPEVDNFV